MALVAAAAVFVVSALAGLLGLALNRRLRPNHLHSRSKEAVRLIQGLVATITALVLGLLVASASTRHRAQEDGLAELAADVLALDAALGQYGPGAAPARAALRDLIGAALAEDAWSTHSGAFTPNGARAAAFREAVLQLQPTNATERFAQARAAEFGSRLAQSQALLLVRDAAPGTQWPFLSVLVSWLAMLFLLTGLFVRPNLIVVLSILGGAAAVAGAVFLILELEDARRGLLRVSDAPLRFALERMGR